jgi:predicted nucleic acid-binding protein
MIVIADPSAINYLILIGEIQLLSDLYGGVAIPPAVRRELLAPNSPEPVRNWIFDPPIWLHFASPDREALARTDEALDAGERQAIALALDLGADLQQVITCNDMLSKFRCDHTVMEDALSAVLAHWRSSVLVSSSRSKFFHD